VPEAVLLDVVAHAGAERGVDLGLGLEQRRDVAAGRCRVARTALERPRWRTSGSARRTGGRSRRVAQPRGGRGLADRPVQSVSASANCGARATTVALVVDHDEWPSKTSSSCRRRQLQNAIGGEVVRRAGRASPRAGGPCRRK
jgi:hypothetical protein